MRIFAKRERTAASGAAAEVARIWTRTLWKEKLWRDGLWLGVPILQWPTDLQALQEILFAARPRVVIETGTHRGGSAIFFSSMLTLVHGPAGGGKVITMDVRIPPEVRETLRTHPHGGDRIIAIEGDSKTPQTVARVREVLGSEASVLVFLDSDHGREHVLAEMRAFAPLVPPGGWLLVFDTVCRLLADLDSAPRSWATDNPAAAVAEFLRDHPEFRPDPWPERRLVTFAPGGFLRRSEFPGGVLILRPLADPCTPSILVVFLRGFRFRPRPRIFDFARVRGVREELDRMTGT